MRCSARTQDSGARTVESSGSTAIVESESRFGAQSATNSLRLSPPMTNTPICAR